MKLGVLTVPLAAQPLEEVLPYLHRLGVQAVELGAGGYTNAAHLNPKALLDHPEKTDALLTLMEQNQMTISALSCHGNPVHPNKEIALRDNKIFEETVILAERLGVDTVVTFSGCPGDWDGAHQPNWVTCAWPPDYGHILDYQWNEVLIPYWKQAADFAKSHGIQKIALELHPGFCVYNTATLLRLRSAVGDCIGANFDPSHLFWQGIDPVEAIKALKGAIYHFHAKDTRIDKANTAVNGVLDTSSMADISSRSWAFRTVGYGHGYDVWNDIISTLKMTGYDGVISIEHEDALMSPSEGLEKAIHFLKNCIIYAGAADVWWA